MSCCGSRRIDSRAATSPVSTGSGQVASAETMLAAAQPRYLVVPTQTAVEGVRFSTLTAAQDYARRSGGIVRAL